MRLLGGPETQKSRNQAALIKVMFVCLLGHFLRFFEHLLLLFDRFSGDLIKKRLFF
ncbi:hypothetical protein [Idiomarina abyssalis]|uniref:hypothetical protein n=1 Tax=Idiomarina abyssalis TaxID=86102 RepID=UPI003A93D45A